MPLRFYNATSQASVDAKTALANGGTVQLRTGAQPANNAALSGTLILEYTLPNPAFPASSANGTACTAAANGLPLNDDALAAHDFAVSGYGAIRDSLGNTIMTGDVGAVGSGEEFELADLSPGLGDTVALTAINVSEGQLGA